jgi:hypothetical protein
MSYSACHIGTAAPPLVSAMAHTGPWHCNKNNAAGFWCARPSVYLSSTYAVRGLRRHIAVVCHGGSVVRSTVGVVQTTAWCAESCRQTDTCHSFATACVRTWLLPRGARHLRLRHPLDAMLLQSQPSSLHFPGRHLAVVCLSPVRPS